MKFSPYKNDVFGLGLSVLELGNASHVKDVYGPGNAIDEPLLNGHL